MLKIISFIIEKVGIKFDPFKIKKLVNKIFIISEKIIIKLPSLITPYLGFYNEMINKEIKLADINANNKILFIGSGPIPATPLILVKKTDAYIVAIDKNPVSVKQAKCLIKKLKQENNIKIELGVASGYPLESFDLIIVAQGLQPYKESLDYIAKSIKSDTKVIFRTSSTTDGNLTEKDYFLKDIFSLKKIIRQEKNGLLISILLLKK